MHNELMYAWSGNPSIIITARGEPLTIQYNLEQGNGESQQSVNDIWS
jgi:hypothetical protein